MKHWVNHDGYDCDYVNANAKVDDDVDVKDDDDFNAKYENAIINLLIFHQIFATADFLLKHDRFS